MKRFGFFITALVLLFCTSCEDHKVPIGGMIAEVSDITDSSAKIGISTIYTRVTDFGVYLSTNPNPTTSDKRCNARVDGNNTYYYFELELTERKPNTTYYMLP